jgi:hypothetical protein
MLTIVYGSCCYLFYWSVLVLSKGNQASQLQNFGVARTRPNPEAGEEDKKALLEGTHRGTNKNKNM